MISNLLYEYVNHIKKKCRVIIPEKQFNQTIVYFVKAASQTIYHDLSQNRIKHCLTQQVFHV